MMAKKCFALFIALACMFGLSAALVRGDEPTLYNVAYRANVTVTGATASTNVQMKEWRLVNGIKGVTTPTAKHDFFQVQALATTATQFEILIDLEDEYPVSKFAMTGGNSAYPTAFYVDVSEDNDHWSGLGSGTGYSGYTTTNITASSPITARYVKMTVTASSSTTPAISELEVFSIQKPKLNVLNSGAASFENATQNGTNAASNAVNGISAMTYSNDAGTYFSTDQAQTTSAANAAWKLKITMNSIRPVSKIVLVPGKSAYPVVYTIDVSVDGTNWDPVVTQSAGTGAFVPVTYYFDTVNAKYIRLNVASSNTTNPSVSEVEAYGTLTELKTVSANMQMRKSVTCSLPVVEGRELSYVNDGIVGTVTPVLNNFTQIAVVNTSLADDAAGIQPDLSLYQYVPWDLTLDLGRELNVTTIKVVPGKSAYVKQFKLYLSTDGDNWTEKVYETNGLNNYNPMAYDFATVSARYVRFEALENSHWKPCVSEIIVENQANMNTPFAQDVSAEVYSYMPSTGVIAASDGDSGDTLEYFILQQPQHGKLTLDGSDWEYISNENIDCEDSFVVGVDDGYGVYASAAVLLDVHKTLDFGEGYQFKNASTHAVLSEVEEGEIECSISVENIYTHALPCVFIAAAYQNGVLKDVAIAPQASVLSGETVEYSENVTVGAGDGYFIKTFVWKDINDMTPYIENGFLFGALSNKTILAFGDSITNSNWTSVIQKRFGCTLIDAGIPGSTSNGGIARLQTDVLDKNPDYVLIGYGGMNDHVMTDYNTPQVTLEQYRENLEQMVTAIRGIGAIPILITTNYIIEGDSENYYYSRHNAAYYTDVGGAQTWLDTYVNAMRSVAADMNVDLVDMRTEFEKYNRYEMIADGVHPTAAGYAVYGKTVGDYLETEFN